MANERERDQDLEAIRQLWAGRFQGVLSTQSLAEPGYPFGSVVPYCLDGAGRPIFLLSHLAQHCKNLDTDPRCAFTIAEPAAGDVQQNLRLTCVGDCSTIAPEEVVTAQRYFSYFPQGRGYVEELNFRLYRLEPRRFHYNGGFATARWLGTDRVLRTSYSKPAQEKRLVEAVEKRLPLLLTNFPNIADLSDKQARIAGIDPWGLDLAVGACLQRIAFPNRAESWEELDALLGSPGR